MKVKHVKLPAKRKECLYDRYSTGSRIAVTISVARREKLVGEEM